MTDCYTRIKDGQFLSTPSARRATQAALGDHRQRAISIHALREEGDVHQEIQLQSAHVISIHALREEGDLSPVWFLTLTWNISIHALREEGDGFLFLLPLSTSYFYPRPPRGGRPGKHRRASNPEQNFYPRPPRGGRRTRFTTHCTTRRFLSTPSARRAT